MAAVIARGNIATTSTFYTDEVLRDFTNQAYRWASAYKKWPFTEGRTSTTFASLSTNQEGNLEGTYPEGWKSDSVRLLRIGGKRLQKLNFEDFMIFREERASANDRVFADLGNLYFVNPNADVSGSVVAYGQFTPASLDLTDSTSSTDTTVFSNREEDANEAVVYEAISYLKAKEKKSLNEAQYFHERAIQLLEGVWARYLDEAYQYQTKDRSLFKRFDIFKGIEGDELFNRDQF